MYFFCFSPLPRVGNDCGDETLQHSLKKRRRWWRWKTRGVTSTQRRTIHSRRQIFHPFLSVGRTRQSRLCSVSTDICGGRGGGQKPFTEDPASEGSNIFVWFGSLCVLPSPWMYCEAHLGTVGVHFYENWSGRGGLYKVTYRKLSFAFVSLALPLLNIYIYILDGLKGQCHEIFCFWFFSWMSFLLGPEYTIGAVSNFFENSRRYSQLKVDHQYQRHRWQICHGCQRHRQQNFRWYQRYRWQICHRYQRHRRQILPPVSLVLLIPVANLPPVSTIPAANLPLVSTAPAANFAASFTSVVDSGGKFATGIVPVSTTPVANNGINIRLQIP